MYDFALMWISLPLAGRVFMTGLAVGGAGFVICWLRMMACVLPAMYIYSGLIRDLPGRESPLWDLYYDRHGFPNPWRLHKEGQKLLLSENADDSVDLKEKNKGSSRCKPRAQRS